MTDKREVFNELKSIVDKWDNYSLTNYLTPEELGKGRERAVESLANYYAPFLQKIDPKYHVDFIRFVRTGEASPEFMSHLEGSDEDPINQCVDEIYEREAKELSELGRALRQKALETNLK